MEAAVNKYASEVDLDSHTTSDLDEALAKICSELKVYPKSISHTRNHLRRQAAGFKVLRDLEIVSPDGGSVLADVYLPLQPDKKFPVLVSCTLYGRRVPWGGPDLRDEQDILRFERAEDQWHSTPAGSELELADLGPWSSYFTSQRGFENIATFNTFSYVPYGYAMVKIDPKGVSQTPGTRWVPGQLAGDFYTAIEWCAEQRWSNGNVAIVGSSYGANTQWAVAGLRPKGLKCMVPYCSKFKHPSRRPSTLGLWNEAYKYSRYRLLSRSCLYRRCPVLSLSSELVRPRTWGFAQVGRSSRRRETNGRQSHV